MKLDSAQSKRLREELQHRTHRDLRLRRLAIGLSLIGLASMVPVSLFQTGAIRHLPDPPLRRFDSDGVNSSETAYHYGGPDGPMSLAGHAVNIAIAAYGGTERAVRQPWIPLLAAAKAGAEAAIAVKYLFYEMPIAQKRWCGYCIVDALMHMGTFALILPEAARSAATLMTRRDGR
jgi:uncharacterized membrane protein